MRVVGGVRVVHPENGDRSLERAVWIGLRRHEGESLDELWGNGPSHRELRHESIELRPAGQLPHPEQIRHFLEGGLAREIVDVVAPVGETAAGAVEIAELGFCRDHAFETADELGTLSHARLLSGEGELCRHGAGSTTIHRS